MPHAKTVPGEQFGTGYRVANNEEVKNEGEKHPKSKAETGHNLDLTFQVHKSHFGSSHFGSSAQKLNDNTAFGLHRHRGTIEVNVP